jgi:hypothetical protein
VDASVAFAPESVALLAHAANPAANTKIRKSLVTTMLPLNYSLVLGFGLPKHVKFHAVLKNDSVEPKATVENASARPRTS